MKSLTSPQRYFSQSKWVFLIAFACLIQGCVLYPKYERPFVEIPPAWRIPTDESATYANIDWWKQLNDPVLNCLIDEALENNRDLKVAIARVFAFEGQLSIVRSNLYPQISGSLSGLRQESSLYIAPPSQGFPRIYDVYTCLLNASYDLDIWGEIKSASDAALAELLGSIETRRTVVLTVVAAVSSSYILMRQYDMQLDISKKTYESRKESYDLAVARYEGGLTSELEVKQAEAEMETAAAQILNYQLLVAEEENLLSILVGHAPSAITRGLSIEQFTMPNQIPAGIPSDILEQRPDISAAEYRLKAANAEIGVARAQFLPSFSLTGEYGNASLQLKKLLTSPAATWQYATEITQPIFTGGRLTGQLEVAQAEKCEAFYLYQEVVLTALKEVDDALIEHKLSLELIKVQARKVSALTEALHLAQLQYDNGQVDYLNVLDVQRSLFAAQLELAEGQSFTFLSLVNIYKALGGGWVIEADAQALNAKY